MRGGQAGDGAGILLRDELVGDDAHLYAALGGGQQLGHQQGAGFVLAPDEGLDDDRGAGLADQVDAQQQGVVAVFQQGQPVAAIIGRVEQAGRGIRPGRSGGEEQDPDPASDHAVSATPRCPPACSRRGT